MNKHTAIMPDGTVATRNSKTRTYTHCLGIKWEDDKTWGAYSWHGSRELAEKAMQTMSVLRHANSLHRQLVIIETTIK